MERRPQITIDRPASWGLVVVIAVCMVWLTWSSRSLERGSDWWWSIGYAVAAVAIVLWRSTWHRGWLVAWGAVFGGVEFSRACLLGWEFYRTGHFIDGGDRASAVPLNALLVVFAWRFNSVQGRWST